MTAIFRFSAFMLAATLVASCAPEWKPSVEEPGLDVRVRLSHALVPPGSDDLTGQTWQVGSANFSFQGGNNVLVRGGSLTESMPTGAPGTYTYDPPMLQLEVLGRSYTGSLERGLLTLNGRIAAYLGPTETIFPDTVLHYPPLTDEE